MPTYKVTGTDEVRTTYEIYVEAADAQLAEAYAARLNTFDDAPGAIAVSVESTGGEIDSVQLVDAAPAGMIAIKPAWKGGVALEPAR